MKILSISHYDLDGFGCQLCIDAKFPNAEIEFVNCGYESIKKTINNCDFNNYDLIFITDLNFNGTDLEVLKSNLENVDKKVIYIDHHIYDEETLKIFKSFKNNFKLIIDTSKSASKKTFEVLKLDDKSLYNLINIIDVFDIWQTDKREFKFAKYFNEWFWFNSDNFLSLMKRENYNFKKFLSEIKELKNEIEFYYKNNPNKKFTYDKNNKMFLSTEYKYSSLLEDYFDYGIAIFVNTKDGKSGRISIRDKYNLRDEIEKYCHNHKIDFGGHKEAYGMTIKKDIKKVVDELLYLIDSHINAPF